MKGETTQWLNENSYRKGETTQWLNENSYMKGETTQWLNENSYRKGETTKWLNENSYMKGETTQLNEKKTNNDLHNTHTIKDGVIFVEIYRVRIMEFNDIVISATSWPSVMLMEETRTQIKTPTCHKSLINFIT
jgi:hypothetical protein